MSKILLFIPMYNCEKQIPRVLGQLTDEVCSYLSEVIVVNNRSTDGGEQVAADYLKQRNLPIKAKVLRNDDNYGLGGSHKVAFQYAMDHGFDYVIVLHGDDQGDISNILPYLKNREYEKYDCFLGARFMKGSQLQGYSAFRTFGNRVYDLLFSAVCRYMVYDLGSGLNMEDESEENIAKFKGYVDYAHSRGIEIGGYSLLASRWISDDVDVINPETGKRGGMTFGSSPCLSSEWGHEYFRKIKTFFEKTGMDFFEHDGSYSGDPCASTSHAFHKGLEDSQWKQRKMLEDLYKWMRAEGIYMNVPDEGTLLIGSTKCFIGYREVNWSLPRDRQIILGRQNIYDGTWKRIPTSSWTFTPLVQYQGGGAAATIEPLDEHLDFYKAQMIQNYGSGVQSCYRGFRLYDTERTKEAIKEIISWYKAHRDILCSDIIHLRRPDGRDWDGIMHVNPSLEEKGFVMLYNPTDKDITRTITLPLYYTGLTRKARIQEQDGKVRKFRIDRKYNVRIKVTIPANGHNWLVIR